MTGSRILPALPAFSPPAPGSTTPVAAGISLPELAGAAKPILNRSSVVQTASGSQATDAVDPALRKKAEEAAVKFESFFINQMLRNMRHSVREVASEDSPYKNEINDGMLDMADGQVADKMAQLRSFGIANAILRQILPQPDVASPTAGRTAAPKSA